MSIFQILTCSKFHIIAVLYSTQSKYFSHLGILALALVFTV